MLSRNGKSSTRKKAAASTRLAAALLVVSLVYWKVIVTFPEPFPPRPSATP